MVEVDASDVSVGAVLSQRSGDDQELHPCAFFSRHLTPAERNYDLSNRELLAPHVVMSISEPILRSSCIVGAAIWQVEEQVCEVLCSSRLPTPCSSPTLPALRWGDQACVSPGAEHVTPSAATFLVAIHGPQRQSHCL